ncbi:hypothetical protein F5Y17DRAFT_449945 [Xylariaceae sp. FL0594]|nr:hypothetical protein F5Y17DRAFT_449945 [Xylariaceae sp. FL0594]
MSLAHPTEAVYLLCCFLQLYHCLIAQWQGGQNCSGVAGAFFSLLSLITHLCQAWTWVIGGLIEGLTHGFVLHSIDSYSKRWVPFF